MKVLRNVTEAPIYVLGLSREEAEERAITMLEKVGLKDKLDQYPRQLLGGQQQRVTVVFVGGDASGLVWAWPSGFAAAQRSALN